MSKTKGYLSDNERIFFFFFDNLIIGRGRIWTLNGSVKNTKMCQLSYKAIFRKFLKNK